MSRALTGLDHPLVGVADLEAARAGWIRLGFTPTPRGRHVGWGTANYCIMFPDSYLELLGVVDPGQFTAGLAERLAAGGEGMLRFGLGSPDAAAAGARLRAGGVAASEAQSLTRLLELPEGDVEPSFTLVHLPDDALPGLPLFVCQHLTPQLLRRPEWLRHPNGATGIVSITAVVERPADWFDRYRRIFGAGACTMTDDTLTVQLGNCALVLVAPHDLDTMHPDAALPAAAPPYYAALRFSCLDTDVVEGVLTRHGVDYVTDLDGTVRVAAGDANGVIVEFGR
ncbi:MAG: VOC family protein [Alphaproteobacteria bacterium]|jgi:hypothetical protein|nr:VOC family protein [Alphaproteobacteria bacterium]